MSFNFRPLGNKVVLRLDSAQAKTDGGVLIPDSYQTDSKEATVVAVGPGTDDYEMTVEEGDRVLFSRRNAVAINVDGSNYLLVPEPDILGIL